MLIQPTLVLTSAHLARPWRDAFARPWDDMAEAFQLTAALDSLSVQFPGQEAVPATLFALAGNSDLALLQIPLRPNKPLVPAAGEPLKIAQEVAVLLHAPVTGQPLLPLSALRETRSPERRTPQLADPVFLKALVSQVTRDATGQVTQVTLDQPFAPAGGGGGPVVNRQGELVGLTRSHFHAAEMIFLARQPVATRRYGTASVQAVPLEQILHFLQRVGVIITPPALQKSGGR